MSRPDTDPVRRHPERPETPRVCWARRGALDGMRRSHRCRPRPTHTGLATSRRRCRRLWHGPCTLHAACGARTRSARDIAIDLVARSLVTPIGRVHAGFFGDLASLWVDRAPGIVETTADGHGPPDDGLSTRIQGKKRKPIVFSGHSLGGAMATI